MNNNVPRKLYFAYGSNLYKPQMRTCADIARDEYYNRCPDSIEVVTYTLHEYRLAFVGRGTSRWGVGGVATVILAAGHNVNGALYRISQADEAILDVMEGVANGSYYKDDTTILLDSEPVLIYIATTEMGGETAPSEKYINRIREGYRQWGLPLENLAEIKPNSSESVMQ